MGWRKEEGKKERQSGWQNERSKGGRVGRKEGWKERRTEEKKSLHALPFPSGFRRKTFSTFSNIMVSIHEEE